LINFDYENKEEEEEEKEEEMASLDNQKTRPVSE
jgi:hypothetical protein